MFKKDITLGAKTKLKSSAQRAIRAKVCDTYPLLAPHIDAVIPKKAQLDVVKIVNHTQLILNPLGPVPGNSPDARATLYILDTTPLFYQHMDDAIIPHLSLVHRYPDMFPRVRVDRGAVRFVLSGATLMVPGLTSPGGRLPSAPIAGSGSGDAHEQVAGAAYGVPSGEGTTTTDDDRYLLEPELPAGTVVVVEAEGKEHACSVGVLKMGTAEMKDVKKGVGIEGGHYLGDGLWKVRVD